MMWLPDHTLLPPKPGQDAGKASLAIQDSPQHSSKASDRNTKGGGGPSWSPITSTHGKVFGSRSFLNGSAKASPKTPDSVGASAWEPPDTGDYRSNADGALRSLRCRTPIMSLP